MFGALIKKIVGSKNERELKRLWPIVERINAMEPEISRLTDEQLRNKTAEFRERLGRGETLDAMLPEAFAVCREAGKRVHNMRHFDVQLIGGMVLHSGKIAEMKTGEGKTLVATLPAYLNALTGRGVHVHYDRYALHVSDRVRKTVDVAVEDPAWVRCPFAEARRIVLLASGTRKVRAVARAVEGPITASVTASALQLHPDATVIVDEEAASELKNLQYYRQVEEMTRQYTPEKLQ